MKGIERISEKSEDDDMMIPKIIHLCWFSGDAFPEDIERCLRTWKLWLHDYKIYFWGKLPEKISCLDGLEVDVKTFDLNSVAWTKQAFENRKYAFAADYIRLYALYTYGGIYLDSDVIVYKSFDNLLGLPYFIGQDQIHAFEAAVIGAEKGCRWIKEVWDIYKGKSFVKEDGSLDTMELPIRFHHVLTELGYRFRRVSRIDDFEKNVSDDKMIMVFDSDFFNSRNAVEVRRTKRSYCAHNYAGSWGTKTDYAWIKRMLPNCILGFIYRFGQSTYNRNKYKWFQIPFEK